VLDLNSSRWVKLRVSGTPPCPRYAHSVILAGQRIVIDGGKGEKNQCYRDLHALDPVTMTWYQGPDSGGSPPARYNHSATLVGGTRMFLFGGWNGQKYYDDLYYLDLEMMA
jgi:N-acetylneuraminic acid mutarotase